MVQLHIGPEVQASPPRPLSHYKYEKLKASMQGRPGRQKGWGTGDSGLIAHPGVGNATVPMWDRKIESINFLLVWVKWENVVI